MRNTYLYLLIIALCLHFGSPYTFGQAADQALAYVKRGDNLLSKSDIRGAVASYDMAIKLNPKLAIAYLQRGYASRQQGELDKAIEDFEMATELDQRTTYNNRQVAEAFTNRGMIRKNRLDVEAAMIDYNKAIRFYPVGMQAYLERAQARILIEDLTGAVADFSHVLAKENHGLGRKALAYAGRSFAKWLLGKEEEAQRDLAEGRKHSVKGKIDIEGHLRGLEIQLQMMRQLRAQRSRELL